METKWPLGTRFRLQHKDKEIEVVVGESADGVQSFTDQSPLGKALEGWLRNPSADIRVSTPRGEVHYQLLAYQLPAGPWIENSPTLWDAMRIFGPEVAAVNLQKALRLQAKLQSLGVQVQGIIDLETAKWLVAFKESPADAPEPDSRVPPEYRIEYHMHRLEQGNCGSAAIIARTKRKDLKDPFGALSFVRTWKDRIGETCRPALLNVGIGAISDIWNGYHSDDKGLLQEALEFGKEALRIEKNPYTYCALQSIYRALDQDEEADRCIQLAEARGKPCQQNRHGIRRIYDTGNQGGHSPDERDELPF